MTWIQLHQKLGWGLQGGWKNIYQGVGQIPEFTQRESERVDVKIHKQKTGRPEGQPAAAMIENAISAVAAAPEGWFPGEQSCWEQCLAHLALCGSAP